MNIKEPAVHWLLSGLQYVGQPSLFPWVFRQIRSLFQGEPTRYLDFLGDQAERSGWLGPFLAGHELHTVYSENHERVLERLKFLSGNEQEIIREGAARSWSYLLSRDFESIIEQIRELQDSDAYEHRYTAALAPVRFFDNFATPSQKQTILVFWREYENDPRQGLWNLVRQQILDPRESDSPA